MYVCMYIYIHMFTLSLSLFLSLGDSIGKVSPSVPQRPPPRLVLGALDSWADHRHVASPWEER